VTQATPTPLFSWLKALGAVTDRGVDPRPFRDAYLEPWLARATERRLLAALRVAVPVGSFAYALQFERQLGAMSADVRPSYSAYMPVQLRILRDRLDKGA
jgi:hypothetical protein